MSKRQPTHALAPPRPTPAPPPHTHTKTQGDPFVVGLAYWPGGLQADWSAAGDAADAAASASGAAAAGEDPTGTTTNGPLDLHPCNATHRAALEAAGVHFAAFASRVDRLAALKTTFPEELFLTGANPNASAPRVISVVAFR